MPDTVTGRLRRLAASQAFTLGLFVLQSCSLVVSAQVFVEPVAPLAPTSLPALPARGGLSGDLRPLAELRPLGEMRGLQALDAAFDGRGGQRGPPRGGPPGGRSPAPSIPAAPTVSFYGRDFRTYNFSHETNIEDELSAAIDLLPKGATLDLALHGISLPKAAAAIIRAHQRGVAVRLLCNWTHVFPERRGHSRSPEVDQLIAAGVEMRALKGSGPYGVMHSKFALFNGQMLEYGSFNWSKPANTQNFENALFRKDPRLIAAFQADWMWMWQQATPVDAGTAGTAGKAAANGIPVDTGLPLRFRNEPWPQFSFSPNGGVKDWILKGIAKMQSGDRIDIADFGFYSQDVADALLEAKGRGVVIRIVMDRSQAGSSPLPRFFVDNGFDFKLSRGHSGGVMHHKFILFNGELLEDGSYNLSPNAELHNFENAIWSAEASDLAAFQAEFDYIYSQSQAPELTDVASFPTSQGFLGHEDVSPYPADPTPSRR